MPDPEYPYLFWTVMHLLIVPIIYVMARKDNRGRIESVFVSIGGGMIVTPILVMFGYVILMYLQGLYSDTIIFLGL